MSRIGQRFAQLRQSGRKALIPFITAGDPDPKLTVGLMHALVAAGADVLELGVPFSDPMADGPTIQLSYERALKHHVTLHDVLAIVKTFRAQDQATPVVLMGYLNPVEITGYAAFAAQASDAGVDGVLTVDLPPEEAIALTTELARFNIDPIFLLAPTSTLERIEVIANVARGFIYYVALRGVTGSKNLDPAEVEAKLAAIRTKTALPLGVGFGIDGPEAAARVGAFADAVIVGSAIVKRVAEHAANPAKLTQELSQFVGGLRQALDRAVHAAYRER